MGLLSPLRDRYVTLAERSPAAFAALASMLVVHNQVHRRHELTLSRLRGGFLSGPSRALRAKLTRGKTLWVHAASAGETNAALPVVRRLEELGHGPFLFTTTTYQGRAIAERGGMACVCYRPFDMPGLVDHVLSVVAPRLLLLVEAELWPNLLTAARRRSIPIALVNAELSPTPYPEGMATLYSKLLGTLSAVGTTTEAQRDRFIACGLPADRVQVTGDLKVDAVTPRLSVEEVTALRAELSVDDEHPLLVAGSTHHDEERQIFDLCHAVRRAAPDGSRAGRLRALVAPIDVRRAPEIVRMARSAGLTSELAGKGRSAEVLVLDRMGFLARCYSLADVAFVGGSLVPGFGGHNVWEAVAQGKQVIYGPFMARRAVHDELEREQIAARGPASALAGTVLAWLADGARGRSVEARCDRIVSDSAGATERATKLVTGLLEGGGLRTPQGVRPRDERSAPSEDARTDTDDTMPTELLGCIPRSRRVVVVGDDDAARGLRERGFDAHASAISGLRGHPRASCIVAPGLLPETPILSLLARAHTTLEEGGTLLLGVGPTPDPAAARSPAHAARRANALARIARRMGFAPRSEAGAPASWLSFERGAAPKLTLHELTAADAGEVRELFAECFGRTMSAATFDWKYGGGRGGGILARNSAGRLVASYTTVTRRFVAHGRDVVADHAGDTMVGEEGRAGMRSGGFYTTAATTQDLFQAWREESAFGYGFAGDRAMRLGAALGVYAEIGRIDLVRWPPLAAAAEASSAATRIRAEDSERFSDIVEKLWSAQRTDLADAVVGVRDLEYLRFRYLNHPSREYELTLIDGPSPAILVLAGMKMDRGISQHDPESLELCDFVGPLSSIPAVVAEARRRAHRLGKKSLYCWITAQNAGRFTATGGALEAHEVRIATSILASPFPVSCEELAGRIWLMSGDTDYH